VLCQHSIVIRRKARNNFLELFSAPVGMGVSHSLHSRFGGFFRHIENRLDVETMQAKQDLEAHFSSVQRICDEIALPSISPRIKYALQRRLNLATQLEILRAPANGTTSPHMKLKAWEELKVLSFTRAAAAVLSLTIVNLQMRVMLNVLSRQLYLEHALSGTPGREGLPSLSVDAQEAFLGLVETGFASTGVGEMLSVVERVVGGKVADLQLAKSLDAVELRELLESIRSELLPEIIEGKWIPDTNRETGDDSTPSTSGTPKTAGPEAYRSSTEMHIVGGNPWESCLLSHGDAVVKAAISREKMASSSVDCTSKLDDEPAFNFETEQIICMILEVRTTFRNESFKETLVAALNDAWNRMTLEVTEELRSSAVGETIAVSKLVPVMSNVSGELLASPEVLWELVAASHEVETFIRNIW